MISTSTFCILGFEGGGV